MKGGDPDRDDRTLEAENKHCLFTKCQNNWLKREHNCGKKDEPTNCEDKCLKRKKKRKKLELFNITNEIVCQSTGGISNLLPRGPIENHGGSHVEVVAM